MWWRESEIFGIESLEGIPDALSLKMKNAEAKAYKILKFLNDVTVTSINFFSDFEISWMSAKKLVFVLTVKI